MKPVSELSRRGLLVLAAATVLAGCGVVKPNPAVTLKAEEAYVLLAAGRFEELFNRFPPQYRNAELAEAMPKMRDVIPPGQASGPPVLSGWEQAVTTDGGRATVTFVYVYPELPVFVTAQSLFTGSDKAGWQLEGFNVEGKRGEYVEQLNLGKGTITPPPKT